MQGIMLTIPIPEYHGDYEKAMRRLVNINDNETEIFKNYFFAAQLFGGALDDEAYLKQLALAFTVAYDADAIYSEYADIAPSNDPNYVNMVYADLVYIFNYLHNFYRTNIFTSRLLQQAVYLDKKITAVEIIVEGLIINIE